MLRVTAEGERARRATAVLGREMPRMEAALRRAVPFLARRDVPIAKVPPRSTLLRTALLEVASPFHATQIAIQPGANRGVLVFDAAAIAIFLDGMLGGDGTLLPDLAEAGLTPAQTALVARIASSVVDALNDTLAPTLHLRFGLLPPANLDERDESMLVACVLEPVVGERRGRVLFMLPKECLDTVAEAEPEQLPVSAGVAAVLDDVEVDMRAELGRIRMSLSDLSMLRVGDTVRLDVGITEAVPVTVGDRTLFSGKPTTSSGRIAIRIDTRHEH
ncbi:MAG: FliM/FliN family flagellar motor switch protein [Deltaproteobacteria bacterium]